MSYSLEFYEHLFRNMVRIRYCEESFVEPILNGDVRTPCHLYSGEEAVAVGLCSALSVDDYIFGNHRSHGHFLAKGGSIEELVAEIYCKETGCSRGRGGSMHLIDPAIGMLGAAPIVAGTISMALGAAIASSIRQDNRVAVSFFGDGATGEGVLYESMNFAALKKLPIIFACENNYYATHMAIEECRTSKSIFQVAEPFGIETHQIDGNDVLKVYEVSKHAAKKCRRGEGPVFIEFQTYRFRGHVGPDDNIQGSHTDIRPKEEIESWLRKDPIALFERYLVISNIFSEGFLKELSGKIQDEVTAAHVVTRNSPSPKIEELVKYVFN